jgi:hypothetical protein
MLERLGKGHSEYSESCHRRQKNDGEMLHYALCPLNSRVILDINR